MLGCWGADIKQLACSSLLPSTGCLHALAACQLQVARVRRQDHCQRVLMPWVTVFFVFADGHFRGGHQANGAAARTVQQYELQGV